jgi:hypothetical protein
MYFSSRVLLCTILHGVDSRMHTEYRLRPLSLRQGHRVVFNTVVVDSLVFAGIANLYLLLMMITTSPRVWGYSDYPEAVKEKVPPQTRGEKLTALVFGLPWFAFLLAYPFFGAYRLKAGLGEDFTFAIASVHLFAMLQLASLVDLVVLDWLIVSRITPKFVMIPGSDEADYKDFSHHFRGHARAFIVITVLALAFAALVTLV